jgi:hypothetical protein
MVIVHLRSAGRHKAGGWAEHKAALGRHVSVQGPNGRPSLRVAALCR